MATAFVTHPKSSGQALSPDKWTDAAAPMVGDYDDHTPEPDCETCESLRRRLDAEIAHNAKALALLRSFARTEAKPARREGLDEDPRVLRAVGYATALTAIKERCEMFLEDARRED